MARAKFLRDVLIFIFLIKTLPSFSSALSLGKRDLKKLKPNLHNLEKLIKLEAESLPESEFQFDTKLIQIISRKKSNSELKYFEYYLVTHSNKSVLLGDLVLSRTSLKSNESVIVFNFNELKKSKDLESFENGFLVLKQLQSIGNQQQNDESVLFHVARVYLRIDEPIVFEWDFWDPILQSKGHLYPPQEASNLYAKISNYIQNGSKNFCKCKKSRMKRESLDQPDSKSNPLIKRSNLFAVDRPLYHSPSLKNVPKKHNIPIDNDPNKKTNRTMALSNAITNGSGNAVATSLNRHSGLSLSVAENAGNGSSSATAVVASEQNGDGLAVAQAKSNKGGLAQARAMSYGYHPIAQEESSEEEKPEPKAFKKKVDTKFENIMEISYRLREQLSPRFKRSIKEDNKAYHHESLCNKSKCHQMNQQLIQEIDQQFLTSITASSFIQMNRTFLLNCSSFGFKTFLRILNLEFECEKISKSFDYQIRISSFKGKLQPKEIRDLAAHILLLGYSLAFQELSNKNPIPTPNKMSIPFSIEILTFGIINSIQITKNHANPHQMKITNALLSILHQRRNQVGNNLKSCYNSNCLNKAKSKNLKLNGLELELQVLISLENFIKLSTIQPQLLSGSISKERNARDLFWKYYFEYSKPLLSKTKCVYFCSTHK